MKPLLVSFADKQNSNHTSLMPLQRTSANLPRRTSSIRNSKSQKENSSTGGSLIDFSNKTFSMDVDSSREYMWMVLLLSIVSSCLLMFQVSECCQVYDERLPLPEQ